MPLRIAVWIALGYSLNVVRILAAGETGGCGFAAIGGESVAASVSGSHWRAPSSCGIACCYTLLRLNGNAPSYWELERRLSPGSRGVSLAAMKESCTDAGLRVEVIKASPTEFNSIDWPGIVHLEGNGSQTGHFVVVLRADDGAVHFLDPQVAGVRRAYPPDFFLDWSGFALVRSRRHAGNIMLLVSLTACLCVFIFLFAGQRFLNRSVPLSCMVIVYFIGCSQEHSSVATSSVPRTQAELIAWEVEKSLGMIRPGSTATASFTIENVGTRDLHLELGRPSCTCAFARLEQDTVTSGGMATLTMGLSGDRVSGPLYGEVVLAATNADWQQTFSVRGFTRGSRCLTDELVIDRLDAPYRVRFAVHTEHPKDYVDVSVKDNPRLEQIIRTGVTRRFEPRNVQGYWVRELEIPISLQHEEFQNITEGFSSSLIATVAYDDDTAVHAITVTIIANQHRHSASTGTAVLTGEK